jgi:hypothetical protein
MAVTRGLVYRVELVFPPGPIGLLHCQIFDGNYQYFPATPGESIHTNDEVVSFDDLYLKQTDPLEFIIKTWNNDDTYEHGLQVRIAMASKEAFMSRYMPSISWDKFSQVLRETEYQQEQEKNEQIQGFLDKIKGV